MGWDWLTPPPPLCVFDCFLVFFLLDVKLHINADFSYYCMSYSVEVERFGRITIPKDLRHRHGIREKTRIIIRERGDQIILIPIASYDNPTDALYASVKFTTPVDDPKAEARRNILDRLREE